MAELTTLEEKLAEVTGLAKAAQEATQKVEGLVDDEELVSQLQRMREEAENEAAEMMSTYLGSDADDLDGFEFLTMAEAGEVGHWEILSKLNEKAGESEVRELVEWALPIQERHLMDVREGSLTLASEEDPNG